MNTYKNNSPFPIIIELKEGRKILRPSEEFKTVEEIAIPGIEKIGFVSEETLKTFPTKPAVKEVDPNKTPIETVLQSLFNARFGSK